MSMGIKALLLDIDGVLTQGNAAVPDAPAALQALAGRGVPFRIVTNSTQRSRATLAKRLNQFGFSVDAAAIFSPAIAAAQYVKRRGGTVYLATLQDVKADFSDAGLALDDRQPDTVILGDLADSLSYAELNRILRF